jgi:hypothetical protein
VSKAYILARISLRWALKGLVLIAVLMVVGWFGGYLVGVLLGKQ